MLFFLLSFHSQQPLVSLWLYADSHIQVFYNTYITHIIYLECLCNVLCHVMWIILISVLNWSSPMTDSLPDHFQIKISTSEPVINSRVSYGTITINGTYLFVVFLSGKKECQMYLIFPHFYI